MPALVRLLDTGLRHWAADALGAIGAAASPAGPALRRLLDAPGAGLDESYARDAAAVAVPWAHYRITGDPEPALRALEPLIGERHTAIHRVADLGAHAIAFAPALRLLARASDPWTAIEAAHALAVVAGEGTDAGHILIRPVADLLRGSARPVVRAAARYLAAADLAPGHVSTIEAVLADDRRHSWDGGWATIHDDIEVRGLLWTPRTALAALAALAARVPVGQRP